MGTINISLLIFFLLTLNSFSLPECEESGYTNWHNCFGTFASPNGNHYVGEWKNGKTHGKGVCTTPSGNKYVGEFKDGKFHGQGTLIKPDGTTLKLLNDEPLDQ